MKTKLTTLLLAMAATAMAQNPNPIRVNQVGYGPNDSKTAAVEEAGWAKKYQLIDATTGKKVWKGEALRTATSPWSGKKRAIVDFSEVTTPGTYLLTNERDTQRVVITPSPYSDLSKAALKAFYLQRSGEPILKEYAGVYARPAAHLDDKVMVHPSAASATRPAGTIIESRGGWYDAGDYNKYIVNSAYTVSIMLNAYEMNAAYYSKLRLDIPESDNSTPDILDEIAVNLRWMLSMQDPEDGGVYHKLTTPNFEGFVKPSECHQQRYVVMKTTAAALDFAATMAKAYRIYVRFPEYKAWAEGALQQAKRAYEWAMDHSEVFYHQEAMNKTYDPDIQTGGYGDTHLDDEFLWADIELFLSTRQDYYLQDLAYDYDKIRFRNPSWGNVLGLGFYSAAAILQDDSMPYANEIRGMLSQQVASEADKYLATLPTSCFDAPCGNSTHDFGWGCNGESVCGKGLVLLYAHKLTGNAKYLDAAKKVADYLLGRNATGYCFVTGFGTFSPMHPHHRLSESDDVEAPLPGFLVGGPNPGQQDKANVGAYPSSQPDESYIDIMPSYASNEIAINWNAALAAFIGWLDNASLSR